MKHAIVIAILSLVIIGCRKTDVMSTSVESLSPEEVNAQIESLRKFIIPLKGVSKEDVDAIFGVPEEIKEFPKGGKGSSAYYPMHIYQLLAPEQGQEFRAFLYVNYKDDNVTYIGINHYLVAAGRPLYRSGSTEDLRQKKEIEMENNNALADLIEIRQKFENKLKDASWNK